jgi:hypothetical protein
MYANIKEVQKEDRCYRELMRRETLLCKMFGTNMAYMSSAF